MVRPLLFTLAILVATPTYAADFGQSGSGSPELSASARGSGGAKRKPSKPTPAKPSSPSRPSSPSPSRGEPADRGGSQGGSQGERGGDQGDRGGSQGDRGGDPNDRGGSQGDRGGDQGERGGDPNDRGGPQGDRTLDGPDARPAGREASPAAGPGARPAPDRTPASRGPAATPGRPISAGVPQGPHSPAANGARPMPANYRPPATAHASPHGNPQGHQAAANPAAARAHAQARAHHRHAGAQAGHRAAAHHRAAAVAAQRAWARSYRSHHPWRFRSWRGPVFVTWYPGYPHYWYHGVFVYGPPPSAPAEVEAAPKRSVEREDKWAIGVRGGTYASGYTNGARYSDFGMGIAARYRPIEPLGIELQWAYHDQSWDSSTERISQPLSVSAEVFAFPWTRFNPYFLGGVTYTNRNIQDSVGQQFVDDAHPYWGPHLGIGLEIGLGKAVSLNGDIRGIGYLNDGGSDLVRQGAVQSNLGLNFYF